MERPLNDELLQNLAKAIEAKCGFPIKMVKLETIAKHVSISSLNKFLVLDKIKFCKICDAENHSIKGISILMKIEYEKNTDVLFNQSLLEGSYFTSTCSAQKVGWIWEFQDADCLNYDNYEDYLSEMDDLFLVDE